MAQVKQLTLTGEDGAGVDHRYLRWRSRHACRARTLRRAVDAVNQRRREIGIRMALGARAQDVLSHVLRGALTMILVGPSTGLAGAVALTRVVGVLPSRCRRWIPSRSPSRA